MGAKQHRSQQGPVEADGLYRLVYSVGVVAFALAFVLGLWYSLDTDHGLPPLTRDYGLERLDPARDTDQLIRELEMFLRIGPVGGTLRNSGMAGYRVQLGQLWERKGDLLEAAENYRQAVALDPYVQQAYYQLALLAIQRGNDEEAYELLRRELRVNPSHAPSHFELARIFERQQRPQDAAIGYEYAIGYDPRHWAAHLALGRIRSDQGDWPRAAGHFSQVLSAQPENAEAHYGLGRALLGIGQQAQAVRHFQQAARLAPGWQPPLDQLRRLQGEG